MIKYLEEDNYKDIIKEGIWIVDFYADWCGPCKMLATVLEELTDINILKINVDKFESIARENNVMSIPNVFIYNNGELKNTFVGYKTKEEIESIIKQVNN